MDDGKVPCLDVQSFQSDTPAMMDEEEAYKRCLCTSRNRWWFINYHLDSSN